MRKAKTQRPLPLGHWPSACVDGYAVGEGTKKFVWIPTGEGAVQLVFLRLSAYAHSRPCHSLHQTLQDLVTCGWRI